MHGTLTPRSRMSPEEVHQIHLAVPQNRPQTTGASCTHGAEPGGGGGGLAVVAVAGAADVVSSFTGGSGGAFVESRSHSVTGGQSDAESRCAPDFPLSSWAAGFGASAGSDALVVATAAAAHALESPLSIEAVS